MNIARAIAIGALIITAPNETTVEPTIKITAPKVPSSAFGLHFVDVNISVNEIPLCVND